MVRIELYDLLSKTQEYIAKYYAAVLTDEHKRDQLKSYIEKFILDGGYLVHGFTEEQLIDRLYSEMVEYSILTPFLGASDLDEININAWDDITLTYSDGSMFTTLGKLVLAICGLVIIVTAVLMLRFTKQIEYRK